MLPTLSEVLKAFYGVWLIACRHPDGETNFDISVCGFWRSFFAGILVLPANILIITVGVFNLPEVNYNAYDAVRDLLIYSITWLMYPVLVINFSTLIGRREKVLNYLVPYNWASVPIGYLFAIVTLLGNSTNVISSISPFIISVVYGIALFLFFEIARQQLKISRWAAVGVVTFDFIFSVSLMSVLGSIK